MLAVTLHCSGRPTFVVFIVGALNMLAGCICTVCIHGLLVMCTYVWPKPFVINYCVAIVAQ